MEGRLRNHYCLPSFTCCFLPIFCGCSGLGEGRKTHLMVLEASPELWTHFCEAPKGSNSLNWAFQPMKWIINKSTLICYDKMLICPIQMLNEAENVPQSQVLWNSRVWAGWEKLNARISDNAMSRNNPISLISSIYITNFALSLCSRHLFAHFGSSFNLFNWLLCSWSNR